MIELLVRNYTDREKILMILAQNGYTVKYIEKQRREGYLTFDGYVVIVEEPKFPEYK